MDDGVSKAQNETNTPLQYLKRLRGRRRVYVGVLTGSWTQQSRRSLTPRRHVWGLISASEEKKVKVIIRIMFLTVVVCGVFVSPRWQIRVSIATRLLSFIYKTPSEEEESQPETDKCFCSDSHFILNIRWLPSITDTVTIKLKKKTSALPCRYLLLDTIDILQTRWLTLPCLSLSL